MLNTRHSSFRAPNARTIFDWLIGTGFLAVDAGAFFVALMVLLPWNLYRSPGDLWVAQPLRTWVFILTFHALVVGAVALARGIVRSPGPDRAAPRAELRASPEWSAPRAQTSNQQTASTLLVQEWARRWLEDDRAEAADVIHQSEEISLRRSQQTSEPESPYFGEVVPWPEAPSPRPAIDAEAILADWLDEQASEYVTTAPHEVDPLHAAASVQPPGTAHDGEATLDTELEWKWVEAAASAWLSKREGSGSDLTDSNGHV